MLNEKYFIAVVSKDHVARGVKEGIIQVCHGKKKPLEKIKKGDFIIFYSPKNSFEGKEKCQSFTAIAQAADEKIYSFQISEDFIPFRRKVNFFESKDISILPIIENLKFINDKSKWGYPFRFGLLEIGRQDYEYIKERMLVNEKKE